MIPKTVHYIWVGGNKLPDKYVKQWPAILPGYTFKLWTMNDLVDIPNRFSNYINNAISIGNYGGIIDLMKCYCLIKNGGIYLDIDMEVLKPFDDLLNESLIYGWQSDKTVNSAIIITEPNNKFICDHLERMLETFQGFTSADNVGPNFLTSELYRKGIINNINCGLEVRHNNITILPCKYFYPLPLFNNIPILLCNDTYTIHRWWGTWTQKIKIISENFDEDFYLTTYPDVANAVRMNQFDSGYHHYLKHGRFEGRKIIKGV